MVITIGATMKKLLISIIILLAFAINVEARGLMMVGGSVAAASCSLGEDGFTADTTSVKIGDEDYWYVGLQTWSNASERCICKVSAKLVATGTITSKTFKARIWTMSGTALNSELTNSPSAAVTGAAWSATTVDFDFSPCVIVGAAASVAITINQEEVWDAENYASIYYTAVSSMTGAYARWQAAKVRAATGAFDSQMKVWW
jgi:hypothetical protein